MSSFDDQDRGSGGRHLCECNVRRPKVLVQYSIGSESDMATCRQGSSGMVSANCLGLGCISGGKNRYVLFSNAVYRLSLATGTCGVSGLGDSSCLTFGI